MKLSDRLQALRKQRHTKPRHPSSDRPRRGWISPWGWGWLAVGLLVAGAGTLAVFEFAIWNKVPPALVGTWAVEEGPDFGGTFTFSRTGNLQVHLKNQKGYFTVQSRVEVRDKSLRNTTSNPQTRLEETHTSTIVELTADSLVLELENGEVLRLVRRQ